MNVAIIITSILSVSFFVSYLIMFKKFITVSKAFTQIFFAYNILKESIENQVSDNDEDIHKENFIKFLSDSRDWAFDYIENVQVGIKKFIDEIEPDLEYFHKYGAVVEGMIAPHDNALKKIYKEFQELKKLLPEDSNDRR